MNSIIKSVAGGAFCLPGNDIDTDRIIPARYLKCVTFEGLGVNVFKDDRAQLGGKHPFDLAENEGKSILVVDENFGSGSSREHAVPALTQWGVKAIIGLSFAAIFRGNAVGNGLVCVTVEPDVHKYLVNEINTGAFAVHVDLERMVVRAEHQWEGEPLPCAMPESHREMLITGRWDSLATALEAGNAIEEAATKLPYMALVAC
ncbi:MAG: isopropylmalate isomerase [Patescibacteria group bacterium]